MCGTKTQIIVFLVEGVIYVLQIVPVLKKCLYKRAIFYSRVIIVAEDIKKQGVGCFYGQFKNTQDDENNWRFKNTQAMGTIEFCYEDQY